MVTWYLYSEYIVEGFLGGADPQQCNPKSTIYGAGTLYAVRGLILRRAVEDDAL